MLSADDVRPLLVAAVPAFQGPADGDGLPYVDAAAFAAHLVGRFVAGDEGDVAAGCAAIERLHVEGDDYVRTLATMGYLEDIQNASLRAGLDLDRWLPFLGAESLRWWRCLIASWSGEVPPPVRPMD